MKASDDHNRPIPTQRVDIVEHGAHGRAGRLTCEIGKHIKLDTDRIASYFLAKWEPIVFDALLVAAGIEFCDRVTRRPKLGWGRIFELRIPVSDPERWKSAHLYGALIKAVEFLTGDVWEITFVKRRRALDMPKDILPFTPNGDLAVLAFSEGLDSRAVAGLMAEKWGDRLIRVRLGTKAFDRPCSSRGRLQPFTTIPYEVKRANYSFPESSARSRGFKFAMLSGIAAYLSKARTIFVPESGQGALAPVLIPVGHAYGDYRNHPLFTKKMSALFCALFNHEAQFDFPRLWFTKGETLAAYLQSNNGAEWSKTRSCWQDNRHVSVDGKRRQCGICAACMLRRLSVHAADLTELPETYIWETLKASTFEEGAATGLKRIGKAQREYAIAGVLHLEHLAHLKESRIDVRNIHLSASQLAKALNLPPEDTRHKLDRLLDKHASEWKSFMSSLGPDSFLNRWIGRAA